VETLGGNHHPPVPDRCHSPLDRVQQRLGYVFTDPSLLQRALTHTSLLQDHPETGEANQRLEFLGDSVLQFVLSEALFRLYPQDREGALSRRRAALTNGRFLSGMARDLELDTSLLLSAGEERSGGRRRDSILEDALEAVIGAIFLDRGFDAARAAVLAWYGPLPARLAAPLGGDNPKGRLQELVQPVHGNQALHYEVIRTEGAPHQREYEVTVRLHDRPLGSGRGSSKKLAEEAAAREALVTLTASAPAE
jgi:ribonuclease-3